jgi:hypothetical protein
MVHFGCRGGLLWQPLRAPPVGLGGDRTKNGRPQAKEQGHVQRRWRESEGRELCGLSLVLPTACSSLTLPFLGVWWGHKVRPTVRDG